MHQILKRLELIKTSIAIDEDEIIELQTMKLEKLDIDDDVKKILDMLDKMDYTSAIVSIEKYIQKYSGVVEYVDTEVQGLKLELKKLESTLQTLSEEKTEYLNDIDEFNREYNLHLGELIKDILNLKKGILYKQTIKQQKQKVKYQEDIQTFQDTKETIDELKSTIDELETALESIDEDDENYEELSQAYNELKEELGKLESELELQEKELEKTKEFIEDETIKQEYEEVNSHYEEFEYEYEHIKESFENSVTLNDEEKKELKSLYKKAARLCHPDIVSYELKEKAHDLMQKLNEAYSKKDISKVKEILHALKNGTSFEISSETIEDKELLKSKIKEYKENIETIKYEIEEIKEDETYQTIDEIDDWDEYFEGIKINLEEEKKQLKKEENDYIEEDNEIEEWLNQVWAWADSKGIKDFYIPRDKDRLLNLSSLSLMAQHLTEFPDISLKYFKNLNWLSIRKNRLKSLPDNFFKDLLSLPKFKKIFLEGSPYLKFSDDQIKELITMKNKGIKVFSDFDLEDLAIKKTHREENISEWIQILWDWGDENKIGKEKLSRKKEKLLLTKVIDLTNIKLSYLPKEIVNLENLQELVLWGCELKYIPREIIKLDKLKKLNLRGNPELAASVLQLSWIDDLSKKGTVFKDSIRTIREETVDMFAQPHIEEKIDKTSKQQKKKQKSIAKENSQYTKDIQSIQNIKFEKIRKYCENLSKINEADEMQKQLGEKGRLYKAHIYSALETFIERINGETITLIDWGTDQGIASMLVLDYIKEKQLDIKVEDIILFDTEEKVLSRAMSQVDVLNLNNAKITAINSINNNCLDVLKTIKNNVTLNLIANDKMPVDILDIDFDLLNEAYFICISNENKKFVDETYDGITDFIVSQDLSIVDGKIGRFVKYERIFKNNG